VSGEKEMRERRKKYLQEKTLSNDKKKRGLEGYEGEVILAKVNGRNNL